MPDHEYNDLKTDIGDIRTIVKNIETKLVGDLNNRGLIGQVHENQKACKSNTESIEILEAEDKKKPGHSSWLLLPERRSVLAGRHRNTTGLD